MKYILKPIEAFQIGMGSCDPEWIAKDRDKSLINDLEVTTINGKVTAKEGDYVIEILPGVLNVIDKKIFEHLYEKYYMPNVRLGGNQLC